MTLRLLHVSNFTAGRCGIRNFGDVVSNLAFLFVGGTGWLWCYCHLKVGARAAWLSPIRVICFSPT